MRFLRSFENVAQAKPPDRKRDAREKTFHGFCAPARFHTTKTRSGLWWTTRRSKSHAFGLRLHESVDPLDKNFRDRTECAILEGHDPDRPRLCGRLDRQNLERQVTATKAQDRG